MYSYPCRSPIKIAVHVSIHLYAYNISRTAEWTFIKLYIGNIQEIFKALQSSPPVCIRLPINQHEKQYALDCILLCYFNVVDRVAHSV